LFASLGLEVAQKVLALYLGKVPVYSTIYGAFAAVPILLIWIYLSWLMVLMGAVVAAYTPSLLSQVKRWPDAPGVRFSMALAVLKALAGVQHGERKGLSVAGLARWLRTDPLQIEPLLETLQALDWVAQLQEDDGTQGARFVLLIDPDRALVAPLAEALLLRQDKLTEGFWREAGLERLTLRQVLA